MTTAEAQSAAGRGVNSRIENYRNLSCAERLEQAVAAAGLRRLGLEGRISAAIGSDEMLPAVGQGALGVETRETDEATRELVSLLDHAPTRSAGTALTSIECRSPRWKI